MDTQDANNYIIEDIQEIKFKVALNPHKPGTYNLLSKYSSTANLLISLSISIFGPEHISTGLAIPTYTNL
jgi:hypothetical protein